MAVRLLVRNVFEPVEVRHGGIVEEHVNPAKGARCKINQRLTLTGLLKSHGCANPSFTGGANRLDGGSRLVRHADRNRPPRRPRERRPKAASRPMLPSVPVMMQTFPESLCGMASYASVECARGLRHCRSIDFLTAMRRAGGAGSPVRFSVQSGGASTRTSSLSCSAVIVR